MYSQHILSEALLMSTVNIFFHGEIRKYSFIESYGKYNICNINKFLKCCMIRFLNAFHEHYHLLMVQDSYTLQYL